MTLGSLFSGAGGFELAGQAFGIRPVWASEIEPNAIRVTSAHFPDMRHLGDIREVHGDKIEPVDIITGGSPCTQFSLASNREGLGGTESCLFWEMIRVIREMREATNGEYPHYVMFENVPGVLSCHGGEDFRRVVEAFTSLCSGGVHVPRPARWQNAGVVMGDGWSFAWRVLDAQYHGLAQRRKRLYAILDCRGERAHEILFERQGGKGMAQSDGTGGEETSAPIGGRAENLCFAVDNHQQDARIRLYAETEPLPTLSRKMGTGGNNVPLVLCVGNKQIHQPLATPQVGALNCMHDQQIIYVNDGTGPILRRLTPVECLRAQGYPDDYFNGLSLSDTTAYRLMGNSVAIPVIKSVMRRIAERSQEQ